jgi:hypothetical protein
MSLAAVRTGAVKCEPAETSLRVPTNPTHTSNSAISVNFAFCLIHPSFAAIMNGFRLPRHFCTSLVRDRLANQTGEIRHLALILGCAGRYVNESRVLAVGHFPVMRLTKLSLIIGLPSQNPFEADEGERALRYSVHLGRV